MNRTKPPRTNPPDPLCPDCGGLGEIRTGMRGMDGYLACVSIRKCECRNRRWLDQVMPLRGEGK